MLIRSYQGVDDFSGKFCGEKSAGNFILYCCWEWDTVPPEPPAIAILTMMLVLLSSSTEDVLNLTVIDFARSWKAWPGLRRRKKGGKDWIISTTQKTTLNNFFMDLQLCWGIYGVFCLDVVVRPMGIDFRLPKVEAHWLSLARTIWATSSHSPLCWSSGAIRDRNCID